MYYIEIRKDDKGEGSKSILMDVDVCKKEGTRGYYLCAKKNI